jgi:hypothetical protein
VQAGAVEIVVVEPLLRIHRQATLEPALQPLEFALSDADPFVAVLEMPHQAFLRVSAHVLTKRPGHEGLVVMDCSLYVPKFDVCKYGLGASLLNHEG